MCDFFVFSQHPKIQKIVNKFVAVVFVVNFHLIFSFFFFVCGSFFVSSFVSEMNTENLFAFD